MPRRLLAASLLIAAIGLIFYLLFLHHTEQYEVAVVADRIKGSLTVDARSGLHLTAPWVQVSIIDLRPMRACVYNAGRSVHCKLVQFDQAGISEFLSLEGFRYYWWDNRISYNSGYREEYRGMRDLIRGYAFGIKNYSFIHRLQETATPQ